MIFIMVWNQTLNNILQNQNSHISHSLILRQIIANNQEETDGQSQQTEADTVSV